MAASTFMSTLPDWRPFADEARGFRKSRSEGRKSPDRAPQLLLVALAFLGATAILTAPAFGDDVVFLKTRDDGAASPKWTGEIIDYTGAELRLKLTTGKERTFPADQVVRVSTALTEAQRAGDELFAAQDFKGAPARYGAASAPTRNAARGCAAESWPRSFGVTAISARPNEPAKHFYRC